MKATDFVEVNPKKMSGTPVVRGTRVPIQNLFDCLEDGETLVTILILAASRNSHAIEAIDAAIT